MPNDRRVRIRGRFLRSVRVDTDIDDPRALDGYVLPQSAWDVLDQMAGHIQTTGQSAFTWTGPYGSGKSSLAVLLSCALSSEPTAYQAALSVLGKNRAAKIARAFPRSSGWDVIPIVGRREDPVAVIGAEIADRLAPRLEPRDTWSESDLLTALQQLISESKMFDRGVLLVLDEMGKLLESAAHDGQDIYVLQQLAELASRSEGHLVVVGLLHQAFDEYSHRVARGLRDEWAKIQGRFVDLAVSPSPSEQIELIARAIESDSPPPQAKELSAIIAGEVTRQRVDDQGALSERLAACWPLHPTVACLLGPLSRRRFGQNQRSIFGFLASPEPFGFRNFTESAELDVPYGPHHLWDYLRSNLEPSILASPDSHKWSLAAEAVDRAEALSNGADLVEVVKAISVIDLLRERSGLAATPGVLHAVFPDVAANEIQERLDLLQAQSLVTYKRYLGAYSVFEGSDFDIEEAVADTVSEVAEIDIEALNSIALTQPILAKRHYHATGVMRWLSVRVVPVAQLDEVALNATASSRNIGELILAIPTGGESLAEVRSACQRVVEHTSQTEIIAGSFEESWRILPIARELSALKRILDHHPALVGDSVAKREVNARIGNAQASLEELMHQAFDQAVWYRRGAQPQRLRVRDLNQLASSLADSIFPQCPRIHNELLNRHKPSASAIAGQNALLRRMLNNEGEPRLGIEGYPAEGGLFSSILESTGLYAYEGGAWRFTEPSDFSDSHGLWPLWSATTSFLRQNTHHNVSLKEIYDLWGSPPFGVSDGMKPILVVAYLLSNKSELALYRTGTFRPTLNDVDVEYLAKDPSTVEVRWITVKGAVETLLSALASTVADLSPSALPDRSPLSVARGLVSLYDGLPQWTKVTNSLPRSVLDVRNILKRATDPNRTLFDDLPRAMGFELGQLDDASISEMAESIRDSLVTLVEAQDRMLSRLEVGVLRELGLVAVSDAELGQLRKRCMSVKGLSGDLRLEAFITRLGSYHGHQEEFVEIASLAANKPIKDWIDLDVDRVALELASMARKLLKLEAFARVKGRPAMRQAMAIFVSSDTNETLFEEFEVSESDQAEIQRLAREISLSLRGETEERLVLAALASISAEIIDSRRSSATGT